MKRCSPLWSRAAWTAILVALVAVSAMAQIQTGNIFGTVAGTDGAFLPGVTVTLTGPGAAQNAVTDAQGRFRFINLSPGSYSLLGELAGYGSATRAGVSVNLGRNAEIAMTLNPSVSQSITVTAEAPLLDIRKTGTGSTVPRVELEKIPTARDPWVILQQTPGVTMDRNNVGGNESGQQSIYVSKGTIGQQSTWNVDGVNITDFAATGSSPTYYDFDAFDEMQITTGGTDPRIRTAGVQVNVVTKRGTNDFSGSLRGFRTSGDYQSDPKIPSEASAYLARINEINEINDQGGEIGGPIIKDRLWFWAAYGEQKIDILSASIVAGARFRDKTTLKNENVKLNAQITPSNSLTFVDQFGAKIKLGRNVSPQRLPATAWNQNNSYEDGVGSLTDPTLWKIEDTQLIGPNLYLTGLYSKVQGGFQLIADNGKGCQDFACGVDSLPAYFDEETGAWTRSYLSVTSLRPQEQYRLDGSAFFNTGSLSHELKFGYGYREANVTSVTAWPGGQYTDDYSSVGGLNGGADSGFVAFQRIPFLTYSSEATDLYVGDTLMMGNLTLQAGLRYDVQKGGNSAGTAPANATIPEFLPAITFPAASGLKFDDISPRLGLTYALGADRRTLLRAAYSRYVDQLLSSTITPTSPGAYANIGFYFNDLNGDDTAQRSEINFGYGPLFFGGFDPEHPTLSTSFTRWADDLKAPTTDELILGVEREVMSDLSVGVNLTYRKLDNFIGSVGEHTQGQGDYYTSADYTLRAPVEATLPDGTKVSLPYYTLNGPAAVYSVIRNTPDYTQSYKGLELTATKRMANRWMLRGNLTLQDWTQDASAESSGGDATRKRVGGATACPQCDTVVFQSTGSGSKGAVYINSKWSASVTGLYLIPFVETSLGFNVNSRQGYAQPYVWLVRGAAGEGTKSLIVEDDADTSRGPTVTQVDLRLAKEIRFRAVGLTLSIDGFNMLNSNTVLQRNLNQLNASAGSTTLSGTSNQIREVLSPRVFRFGARLSF